MDNNILIQSSNSTINQKLKNASIEENKDNLKKSDGNKDPIKLFNLAQCKKES